ncbi:MAG TPA: hypothetical protein VF933_01330 [Streptosporangiaceae bacterium]
MSEILAEAGRITGLGPEIRGKITFGLQSAYAELTGQEPMRFVAPASQMAGLSDEDLIVVRFSRIDNGTVSRPLPVVALSRA